MQRNEGDQALKQVAQGVCVVSILGDIQNPTGHKPEQPSAADTGHLNSGVGEDNLHRSLLTRTMM